MTGVRIIDAATLFAGPLAAMFLGDFGADVIKVEHPRGDPVRTHGHSKDGVPLWWKMVGRNKRTITLNFSQPDGKALLCELVKTADVLIENFRPGTLERWGVGPEHLQTINPRLIVLRTTGFGQIGPYAKRPGFGTLAESMSGFAAITGEPDGPPTLPPFGLADGIAGLAGAMAILLALYSRDARAGQGQVIDLAIIEPILTILGSQPTVYDQLGIVQERSGNRSVNNAPRNTYRTRDEKWVAISTSALPIAERVMRLVGHPEVIDEAWFKSGAERAKHADELDHYVGDWIAAARRRRGDARLRGSRSGRRAHLRRGRRSARSTVRRPREHHQHARRRSGAGEDAERAVPHARNTGSGTLARPPPGSGQRGGVRRAGSFTGATGRAARGGSGIA